MAAAARDLPVPGPPVKTRFFHAGRLIAMPAVRRACSARSTVTSGVSCPAAISRPASAARPPVSGTEAGSSAVIVSSSPSTPAALIVTAT